MKIGIDARFLTHPQVGGFKTYSQNLVRALAKVDSINEYIIYVDRPPVDEKLVQPENFSYRVLQSNLPGIKTAVREQFHLPRAVNLDKPSVVHFLCNTAPVKIPQVPFVLTLHDTIQVSAAAPFSLTLSRNRHKRSAISAYSKWTIVQTVNQANKIVTVSNFEKNIIAEQLNVDRDDICVTHLAPNPLFKLVSQEAKSAWRQELSRNMGISKRFILGIGHEPRKNIPLLIEAFAHIASNHPDLSLVIVAAQYQARLNFQNLVNEMELNGRVVVLGGQRPAVLNQLYNLAEIFVFPSERESFGLPPLEALSCGVPTVAMNMTSLPEILADGALLVDGKDPQTWANVIQRVLSDSNLRSELTQRGLKRASEFTWQKCAEDTLQIYYDVVEGISNTF